MNFLKADQLSVSNLISFINPILLSKNSLFNNIKAVNLYKSTSKITIKFLSSRLNIRPYNKLDKEVIDFRECKEGLVT